MSRYVTTIETTWSPQTAFAFMGDVRNFAEWNPGVLRADQVHGSGPGPGAAYDLEVRAGIGTTTLRYEVIEWDAPRRMVLLAATPTLRSVDEIRIESAGAGAVVIYDAELTFEGIARIANPVLALAFRRIGERAAAGLRHALEDAVRPAL